LISATSPRGEDHVHDPPVSQDSPSVRSSPDSLPADAPMRFAHQCPASVERGGPTTVSPRTWTPDRASLPTPRATRLIPGRGSTEIDVKSHRTSRVPFPPDPSSEV
jgi:hypothetical protein